jgi:hypothetical protein
MDTMERKMQDGTYSYRAASFEVKYLGATAFKESRVKATCHHWKKSKTISWDYTHSDTVAVAIAAIFGDCSDPRMQAPFITYGETKEGFLITAHFDGAGEIVKKFFGVEG